MEGSYLAKRLRQHIAKRRAEVMESFLVTKEVRKARGRVAELDELSKKLTELVQQGESDDVDEAD